MKEKLKILVVYNEPEPELYVKPEELKDKDKDLEFKRYFEVEHQTPMEEFDYIAERLNKVGFEASALNIEDSIDKLLKSVQKIKPDIIFNFIEIYKEKSRLEMNIASLLELLGIPYTGAPPMAIANCQNKVLTKRYLKTVGISTPDFFIVKEKLKIYKHKLKYPLIVKPAWEDASVGIENDSIVENHKSLSNRIEYILNYFQQPALVEEFIDGRELNVAVLGDKKVKALPISEIAFDKMPDKLYNIVSYQAKWEPHHEAYHKTIPVCPAKLPKQLECKAKGIAIRSFRAMDCRDYARVDMRLSKENKLYVLEVNPNPDLTEGAGFMRSAENHGLSYGQTLKRIALFAYRRAKK